MQTRTLGPSDLELSIVGLGCNNFGREGFVTEGIDGTRAVLDACLEQGVTFLDTADVYGDGGRSEELMGEALEGRRDAVVLATKWGAKELEGQDFGPLAAGTAIKGACEASLRRLRTDHIDLYQLHVPHPETPILETLAALNELVDEGKIRAFGHSNFTAEQAREAADVAAEAGLRPFVSAQNNYSLVERGAESSLLPALSELGLGFLPYFPLASGLLTGKYTRDHIPEGSRLAARPEQLAATSWDRLQRYQALCDEAGVSMLGATFAWLLSHDVVTSVIAGATRPEQVVANAEAGRTVLSPDVIAAIDALFAETAAQE